MCENPGVCTFIQLRRCPAIHLVSKNAHSCSRNHSFTHLMSKTAPSCSRTPAILACPPSIRARLASIPCQPRRLLGGSLARSRFFRDSVQMRRHQIHKICSDSRGYSDLCQRKQIRNMRSHSGLLASVSFFFLLHLLQVFQSLFV